MLTQEEVETKISAFSLFVRANCESQCLDVTQLCGGGSETVWGETVPRSLF